MSNAVIQSALLVALTEMVPAIPTVLPNEIFRSEADQGTTRERPYQKVDFLFATPENETFSGGDSKRLTKIKGFMQVSLRYPLGEGEADIQERIELIRTTFQMGFPFIGGSVSEGNEQVVTIQATPDVRPGRADGKRWVIDVFVPFYANVFV